MPRSKHNAWNTEFEPNQANWLDDQDHDTQQHFFSRATRKARKPPRRQTVKKLLEEGIKDPKAPKFSDPGLQALWEKERFSELLWELRSGKEATVYVVQGPPPDPSGSPLAGRKRGGAEDSVLLAAKLYVDSRVRSFKNDALYREGRFISNDRVKKAIDQRSEFGISAQNVLWVEEEYRQLHALHKAGVAVPQPIDHAGNVILMEFIGDADGPAPRLSEAGLSKTEAQDALDQAIRNLGLMLASGKVHGDYSTFNLLWWEGRVVVIDFPQVVEWDKNPNAMQILERDVNGLCRTFSHLGLRPKGSEVLRRVWQIAHANPTPFTPVEVTYL